MALLEFLEDNSCFENTKAPKQRNIDATKDFERQVVVIGVIGVIALYRDIVAVRRSIDNSCLYKSCKKRKINRKKRKNNRHVMISMTVYYVIRSLSSCRTAQVIPIELSISQSRS